MPVTNTNIPVTIWDAGLKQDKSSLAIDPSNMPNCQNISLKDGLVSSRTGLVYFYPTSGWEDAAGSVSSAPNIQRLGYYHHEDFENDSKLFFHFGLIDDTAKYRVTSHYYDLANTRWALVANAGEVTEGAYDYWFNVCEVIDDEDSDGTPDTDAEFLILNVTPTGTNVSNGCYIQQYNTDIGSGAFTAIGTNRCKRVLFYNGRLILLGTNKFEIMWSEIWDHDDILTAEAFNYYYAYDTGGAILNGELLKGEIICYKEDSIYAGYKISTTPFIRWESRYPDVGLMSSRLLAKYGQAHFFVGTNNIYAYSGGSELYPIGNPIWSQFVSDMRDGGVSNTQLYKDRCFASVHRDTGEIAFWIVTGTAEWPNVAYVYNVLQKSWSKWKLPDNADVSASHHLGVQGWGEYEHDNTINDANMIPFYTVCRTAVTGTTVDNLKCAKFDYSTRDDISPTFAEAGNSVSRPIYAWADTKDFVRTLSEDTAWFKIYVDGKGYGSSPTLSISMSINEGVSQVATEITSLVTTHNDRVSAIFNIANHKARFRVSMNSAAEAFSITSFEIEPTESEAEEL